ncbi:hypothetical protein [Synechocystis sp. CACIAM 05]|uniref:hypothetical protein n=1 Tax=Synechocystis sp. CACIAM 05 TaxID=1933929 RepID=UPI001950013F|nr:hypothetical protein [Synechocystis sp. CACIAM 05]
MGNRCRRVWIKERQKLGVPESFNHPFCLPGPNQLSTTGKKHPAMTRAIAIVSLFQRFASFKGKNLNNFWNCLCHS